MRIVDANLLLYAVDERAPTHEAARAWLDGQLSGTETTGLGWASLLAFVRVGTNPRVYENPLTVDEALDRVAEWLSHRSTVVVGPGARHADVLRELLAPLGSAGNLVSDAHIAAIAIEHGAVLCSADTDFGRFSGLRWENPLDS